MSRKLHPLVQKTKVALKRLDTITERRSWEDQREYNREFLPIDVEPKLRERALRFMNDLIQLLEKNGHDITFKYDRCHIEMYGQLTEIKLRQKYFRKRVKDRFGYDTDTYEKSDLLEFQIGYHARKGWIDKKTKKLEDYLEVIYDYVDKDSKQWAELRERQRIQKERERIQEELETEKAEKLAYETEKLSQLLQDAKNHQKAKTIRRYLASLKKKASLKNESQNTEFQDYLKWAHKKADEIDPLAKSQG